MEGVPEDVREVVEGPPSQIQSHSASLLLTPNPITSTILMNVVHNAFNPHHSLIIP